jgi:hypothetical protein
MYAVQAEKVPPIYEESGPGVFRKGADRELAKITMPALEHNPARANLKS